MNQQQSRPSMLLTSTTQPFPMPPNGLVMPYELKWLKGRHRV
jgi:hypothetical protein